MPSVKNIVVSVFSGEEKGEKKKKRKSVGVFA
jgi:hypothetical protein